MPVVPEPWVATLVAFEGAAGIEPSLLADLGRALDTNAAARWLDPGRAVEIAFEATPAVFPALRTKLEKHVGAAAVDIAVQPGRERRKRLLLADMDSTMIGQECIDELAGFAGLGTRVAAITERAMRGEISFEPALRERVALLAGLHLDVVARVLEERITLTPGGATLVRTMRAHGAYCALVSGGFTLFAQPVAAKLGFDEHRANELLVDDGRLTGLVAEPILGRQAKRACLIELRQTLGLPTTATLAVGDGANDLLMLGEAGLGVAYRAKPAVAAAAHARIDHNDLEALLFFQGYCRSEFVT